MNRYSKGEVSSTAIFKLVSGKIASLPCPLRRINNVRVAWLHDGGHVV